MARLHGETLPKLPYKTVLAVPLMQFVYLALCYRRRSPAASNGAERLTSCSVR